MDVRVLERCSSHSSALISLLVCDLQPYYYYWFVNCSIIIIILWTDILLLLFSLILILRTAAFLFGFVLLTAAGDVTGIFITASELFHLGLCEMKWGSSEMCSRSLQLMLLSSASQKKINGIHCWAHHRLVWGCYLKFVSNKKCLYCQHHQNYQTGEMEAGVSDNLINVNFLIVGGSSWKKREFPYPCIRYLFLLNWEKRNS